MKRRRQRTSELLTLTDALPFPPNSPPRRLELDEVARRDQTDESRVLLGETDGISEDRFNSFFLGFVLRNFALGGGIGIVIYVFLRLPRIMAMIETAGVAGGGGMGL